MAEYFGGGGGGTYSPAPTPPPVVVFTPLPISGVLKGVISTGGTAPPATPTTPAPTRTGLGQPTPNPVVIYTPLPISPIIGGVVSTGGSVTPTTGGGGGGGGQVINASGGVAGGKYGPTPPPNFLGEQVPTYVLQGIPQIAAPALAVQGWDYFVKTAGPDLSDLATRFDAIATSSVTDTIATDVGAVGLVAAEDAGPLEAVAFAGALLLSEYIGGWIIVHAAELIPDINLFGWHPLNWVQKSIENFGKGFEKSATDLGRPLWDVFTWPIHNLLGLFQRSTNAATHAHNGIANIHNNTIPNAVSGVVAQANTYTDNKVSGILATEQSQLSALHHDLNVQIAEAQAAAESHDATALASVQSELVRQLQGDATALAQLATTVTTTVPLEIATAVQQATATEQQRLTATATGLQQQIDAISATISATTAKIDATQATIATLQTQVTNLQSQPAPDTNQITALQTQITDLQGEVTTDVTAISDLNTQITGISNTLAPIHAAQQLNTAQLLPFEIGGAIGLATLVATMAKEITTIRTKLDTCVVDNCDPSKPNNIKNVLMGLLSTLSAAGELAFIAEAVTQPTQTADTIAPGLDTIDATAVTLLDALLSL